MQIGDLVKFNTQIQGVSNTGCEGERGIIVSFSGGSKKFPIVAWFSLIRPTQTEVGHFLEIVNKS